MSLKPCPFCGSRCGIRKNGRETVHVFSNNGEHSDREIGHLMDLIPVPRKVRASVVINVFERNDGRFVQTFHDDRAQADRWAENSPCKRIACIEIDREVTEGEGLE